MRTLLALVSFCLGLTAASNNFSVIIKGPFQDALYDVTEDHDGQIGAVGFSQSFEAAPAASETYYSAFDYLAAQNRSRGEQIKLVRLDDQGETTFEHSLSLPEYNRAVSAVKTPGNGYFIGGYTQDGQMLVTKIGQNGERRFLKRFGTKNLDKMHRIVALRDGGVLAVGTSVTSRDRSDNLFKQGLGHNDISLTRFHRNGQQLWSKKYGTVYDDNGIDATEAGDGSIIVLGTTDQGAKRIVSFMRLGENGDKIWRKEYNSQGYHNAYDLITLNNGRFMTSLTQRSSSGTEQIRLVTFDLQENILNERNISTDAGHALHAIAEHRNGTITGVGTVTHMPSGRSDALAMHFDAQGNTIWKKEYGGPGSDLFRNLKILRDGTIAAVGETVASGSEVTDMWVVKLHDDGSVASKATVTATVYTHLNEALSEEIGKGNVTLGKDLTITLSHPVLLFKVGVYELTPVQKTFLELFSNKLLKALQSYKGQIAGLRINGHTSSEWKGADFTERYLNNAELSTQRAFSVLSHLFRHQANKPYQQWLTDILSNDGYSYSKIVKNPVEDREASRRVAFEIVLK
jgi:outer membrane protein OmpA-like peptidoglycan-associated protein